MADNTATFALELEDDTSGAAESAAGALQKLNEKLTEDTAALRAMQTAMRQLQGGSAVSVEAFRRLRDQIAAQKASIASAQESYVKLGGNFKAMKKPAEAAGAGIEDFSRTLKGAAGGMGGMIERGTGLIKGLGALGVAGVAIIAAVAIAALTLAIIAGVSALADYALHAADAARSEELMLQAAANAGGHAADGFDELSGAVGRVAKGVPIAESKVAGFAEQLLKAGLHGAELEKALQAVSIGDSAGQDAGALVAQLTAAHKAGTGVAAISAQIANQFGGNVKARMMSLDVQTAKLKENFSGLFKGVKIEGFLAAMQRLFSIFDEDTAAGHALKVLAETLLNPLFEMVTKLEPIATAFFEGVIIGALMFTVQVLKIRNAIRDAFGGESATQIDWVKVATYAGMVAAGALVVVLGLLAAAFVAVAGTIIFMMLPTIIFFALLGAAVYAVVYVVGVLIDAFKSAWAWISNLDFGAIGQSMIDGLVNGITNGAGMLIDAIKGLGKSAIKTLESALGIGSPSKVFASLGTFTAQGFAEGVDAGAGPVGDAVGSMVSIPGATESSPIGGAVTNNKTSNASSTSSSKATGPITIYIQAGGDAAKDIANAVKSVLADVLEGAAIEMGAPLEGTV